MVSIEDIKRERKKRIEIQKINKFSFKKSLENYVLKYKKIQ